MSSTPKDLSTRLRLAVRIAHKVGESGLIGVGSNIDLRELQDILPNQQGADEDWNKLLKTARNLCNAGIGSEVKRDFDSYATFDDPLTTEEAGRLRFLYGYKPVGRYSKFGLKWGASIQLAFNIMPDSIYEQVDKTMTELGIWRMKRPYELRVIFKELTGVAKKHGDLLFKGYWKWLVNWELLGGYANEEPPERFETELRSWASGDIVHNAFDIQGSYSEEVFLSYLRSGIREFLSYGPNVARANDNSLSVKEFAERPDVWARSGSSKINKHVQYTVDGKRYNAKRSKWNSALALSRGEVLNMLSVTNRSQLKQVNSVIQKREMGKVRAVVNSDDGTYLRMAYVAKWLDEAMSGHPLSTLYMSRTQIIQLWERLARATENECVKIPLDQSHFDWQQNKRMLDIFCDELKRYIELYAMKNKNDLLRVLEDVRVGLVEITGDLSLQYSDGLKVHIPIEKGIMSGWRWTSILDTAFNYAELYAARRMVAVLTGSDPVISMTAQGDDDQVTTRTYGEAAALVAAYELMDIELNPKKFFVDTSRDEYLRQVIMPRTVSGYPIRGIGAIMWRSPISRDPPAGIYRLSEMVKSWNIVMGRGGEVSKCVPLMIRDLANGNGLSKAEVIGILGTPAAAGGIGMLKENVIWTKCTPGRKEVVGRIDPSTIRGLVSEVRRWNDLGITITNNDLVLGVEDKLELPKGKVSVKPGTIITVEKFLPMSWRASSGGAIPICACRSKMCQGVLSEVVLAQKIKEKDWSWIEGTYIDETSRSVSEMIRGKCSRGVWLDWVEGKVKTNIPTVIGWADLVTSQVYEDALTAYWGRLLSGNNITVLHEKRIRLNAEYETLAALSNRYIHIGG